MKIYTKKGDKGQTSLVGGQKISKGHVKLEAYGTVDELNSHIGLIRDSQTDEERKAILKQIQDILFNIGSNLALPAGKKPDYIPLIVEENYTILEKSIDEMEEDLDPLTNFILPGGHQYVSFCHIARCVCRRAERATVRLSDIEEVDTNIVIFLNRLSDYLFVLARKIGKEIDAKEIAWKP